VKLCSKLKTAAVPVAALAEVALAAPDPDPDEEPAAEPVTETETEVATDEATAAAAAAELV